MSRSTEFVTLRAAPVMKCFDMLAPSKSMPTPSLKGRATGRQCSCATLARNALSSVDGPSAASASEQACSSGPRSPPRRHGQDRSSHALPPSRAHRFVDHSRPAAMVLSNVEANERDGDIQCHADGLWPVITVREYAKRVRSHRQGESLPSGAPASTCHVIEPRDSPAGPFSMLNAPGPTVGQHREVHDANLHLPGPLLARSNPGNDQVARGSNTGCHEAPEKRRGKAPLLLRHVRGI